MATEIHERTGKETRTVTLGHLQRGGQPIPYDRLIALRFGAAAVRQIEIGELGVMVSLDPPAVRAVPLERAASRMKSVPLEADVVVTARDPRHLPRQVVVCPGSSTSAAGTERGAGQRRVGGASCQGQAQGAAWNAARNW